MAFGLRVEYMGALSDTFPSVPEINEEEIKAMKIFKQLLFVFVIVIGLSLSASAQKQGDDKKPKEDKKPPVIVVVPKDDDKPKDKPHNDGKKGKKPMAFHIEWAEGSGISFM